jgi:hypothetical protein
MTAEEQAVVLVNEVRAEREQELWKDVGDRRGYGIVLEALCRALERHETYKQKVSDAVEKVIESCAVTSWGAAMLDPLIIPKPDPLVDVLDALKDGRAGPTTESYAHHIRAALDAVGLEIREKGQ